MANVRFLKGVNMSALPTSGTLDFTGTGTVALELEYDNSSNVLLLGAFSGAEGNATEIFIDDTDVGGGPNLHITNINLAFSLTGNPLETGNLMQFVADLLSGNDTIIGSDRNDTILGFGGNDTLISGGAGSGDILNGGTGFDTASYASSPAAVTINLAGDVGSGGHAAGDTIFEVEQLIGSKFNDTLGGATGNDVLSGGLGKDTLSGSSGRDFFDFNSIKESVKGANRDIITDFNRAVDDRIDLRTIDAKTGVGGNQAFKFIGTKQFSDEKGELRCKNGIVQGDVNGDGVADFEIKVNLATMVAGDFFL